MENLKAAWKAFWVILLDKSHVYCDGDIHSMVGRLEDVSRQVDILSQQIEDTAQQHDLLTEAKNLIK